MSYHQRYIQKLETLTDIRSKDIAVLGCSYGAECKLLVEAGANSVTGYDLDPQLGKHFSHEKVSYCRQSIAEIDIVSNSFDIVYSVAVFEHVHRIAEAFNEAVRIAKPGATIMIISSPLWHAPYGNHMISTLKNMPWCHLLFSPSQLVSEIERINPHLIESKESLSIIERIFDPVYFNRYPPAAYLTAVDQLKGVDICSNSIWPAHVDNDLKEPYFKHCITAGHDPKSLLSGAHFFHGISR
jgi:SAM-dependent methyltransferase